MESPNSKQNVRNSGIGASRKMDLVLKMWKRSLKNSYLKQSRININRATVSFTSCLCSRFARFCYCLIYIAANIFRSDLFVETRFDKYAAYMFVHTRKDHVDMFGL